MFNKDHLLLGARFVLILILAMGLLGVKPIGPVLASTLTVINTNDSGTGSLRQAIIDAVSGDTITFDPSLSGQTVVLSTTLIINKNLIIDGSALASKINISGNNSTRVLDVIPGVTVTADSLIIKNGRSSGLGGGIYNAGSLTIKHSTFAQNQAIGNYSPMGGAIANDGGALDITDSLFIENRVVFDPQVVGGGYGGAIYNVNGTLTIAYSTFNNNSASRGGAISCEAGTMIVTNSSYVSNTVSDQSAAGDGGAIFNTCDATILGSTFSTNSASHNGGAMLTDNDANPVIVMNSTFYGNSAANVAGGVANYGELIVVNSTFSGNSSPTGGAIRNGLGGTLSLRNSILANSVGGVDCIKSDSSPEIESIHNLIETTGMGFESCGTPYLSSDPKLGPLANNGGITQTMALAAGSPAIDSGDDDSCLAADQRGVTRPHGSHCDIGSYEYDAMALLDPAKISFQEIVGGLNSPVFITHAKDGSGRLFVLERGGRIRIIKNGILLSVPFLDIRSLVKSAGSEQGLLGLVFHPSYGSNGKFYVVYTAPRTGDTDGSVLTLRQYSVSAGDPDIANVNSGTTILTIDHPTQTNHNGGTLVFGNDGYLYWSTGDGGGGGDPSNNAQRLDTLLGKILRIDVNSGSPYSVPVSNPFYGNPDPNIRKEIWSYGLRNPWRISFDRATHDLYIGDVGQSAREEINFQSSNSTGGENYGWRVMEGSLCYNPSSGCDQTGKVLPVAEYDHSLGCSVTGGYVYRGLNFPSLSSHYFYGDFCSGRLFSIYNNFPAGWSTPVQLADTSFSIATFGEDEQGELYLADYSTGKIYNIRYQEPSYLISGNAGVAGATLSYLDGTPKTVTSDGSGNYSITVPAGWSGVVTPSLGACYPFTPINRSYSNVVTDQTAQDYTYTLPGGCFAGTSSLWTGGFSYNAGWRVDQHPRLLADVNGDGKVDAVGFGYAGVYVTLANDTGTAFAPTASLWTGAFSYNAGWRVDQHPRLLADVNGDDKTDAVGFGYAGVYVALANAEGTGFAPTASLWTGAFSYNAGWRVDQHPRMLADVNGDGKADAVGFGYAGVYVALANASGTTFAPTASLWTGAFSYNAGWRVDQHPRMLADVNGDGKADAVGFGYAGVYVALANAGGTGFAPTASQWTGAFSYNAGWRVDQHPRLLADVNGDGKTDAVGFGYAGVFVALANDTGTAFAPSARYWTPAFSYNAGWRVDQHPRLLADVNGDGQADAVGFGYAGVYVATSQ